MNYKNKYLKYKNKYLNFINQTGGTAEENNNYLLHGTNLYYIKDIIDYGLNGKYNKKILDIINLYWDNIKHLKGDNNYTDLFLERQLRNQKDNSIHLSFTGKLEVAKEYSNGVRRFGEGPSFFLNTFYKYIQKNRDTVTEQMMTDYEFLVKASKYPGIILAINITEFKELNSYNMTNLDMWELPITFYIPPDKLYIRKGENDYIELLSEEGSEYIKKLENEFLKKQQITSLNVWKTKILNGPSVYNYEIENTDLVISAKYDNYGSLPYFQLQIFSNKDIKILVIIHIKDNTIELRFKDGIDNFLKNFEYLDKLKLAIKGIMEIIPDAIIKKQIYTGIIGIFPSIAS